MECLNKTLSKSRMRQGESFPLRFHIYTKAEPDTATPSYVVVGSLTAGAQDEVLANKVAIMVGNLRKTWQYSGGSVLDTVTYDQNLRIWRFPISQEESLALSPGEYPGSIKVVFEGGNALISEIDPLLILESLDKEVL